MTDLPTDSNDRATEAMPKHHTMTVGQHVFIWSMVLIVGVLFGMGSNVQDLTGPSQSIAGIEQTEILRRQHVARKLQNALGNSYNRFGDQIFTRAPLSTQIQLGAYACDQQETYATLILLARQADAEGLMPNGQALKDIMRDFLNREDPNSSRRFADILQDLGGDKKITEAELALFLSERYAVGILNETHSTTPAVPLSVADTVDAHQEQIEVDEVVIDARPILTEVKTDDAEVKTTYEKVRDQRFRLPPACIVNAVIADQQALADSVNLTDADFTTYYDAHKNQYLKPVIASADTAQDTKDDKKETPKPEYKSLDEVKNEIRDILKREQIEAKSKKLFADFQALTDDSITTLSLATLKEHAAKANLIVKEGIIVTEPSRGGAYQITGVGEIEVSHVPLFNQESDFISNVVQAKNDGPRAILHLSGKREAQFKELSDPEVAKEVAAIVAGERSYKDFLKAMEDLRQTAEKLGPGGLRKALAAEAALKWDGTKKVSTSSKQALTELIAPASEIHGTPGETRLLASLLLPNRPVVLVAEESADGIPHIRLVQAIALKAETKNTDPKHTQQQAESFRNNLEGYRSALFQKDLNSRITRR